MDCLASSTPLVPGRRWSHAVGSEHSERAVPSGECCVSWSVAEWHVQTCSETWDPSRWKDLAVGKVGGSQPVEQVLLCSSSDWQPQTSTGCFPKVGTSKLDQRALLWGSFSSFWTIVINTNSWIAANLYFAFFSYQGLQMFVFLCINTVWKYYPCLLIAMHVFPVWAWKNKET